MEYAEWLEMEREILARARAAFTGERPLAGWEIDGRKRQFLNEQGSIDEEYMGDLLQHVKSTVTGSVLITGTLDAGNWFEQWTKDWSEENARETH